MSKFIILFVTAALLSGTARGQEPKLVSFVSDSGIHLRWIGNTDADISGWNVQRSDDGGAYQLITPSPIQRVLSFEEMKSRVGSYIAMYNLTLHGVQDVRDLTMSEVRKTLGQSSIGFYLALNAGEPLLAKLTGEYFFDSSPAGTTVRYRVTSLGNTGTTLETAGLESRVEDRVPVPLDVVGLGEHQEATISWERNPTQTLNGDVVGYRVFRAPSPEGPYEEITLQTGVPFFGEGTDTTRFTYADNGVENGETWSYYIKHVHATGVLSQRSDIITITIGTDGPPPVPLGFEVSRFGQASKCTWSFADDAAPPFKLEVWRRPFNSNESWTTLPVPKGDTSFVDALIEMGEGYIYLLASIGKRDTVFSDTTSLYNPDILPPSPPDSVWASQDTGKVMLQWSASEDADVIGYHVFRATDDGFDVQLQLTNDLVTDTSWVDKLSDDAEEKYGYTIVAEDAVGNSSQPSRIVEARVLDITPPAPSQFTLFEVSGNIVEMEWSASPSIDVAYYRVERSRGSQPWRDVREGTSFSWIDTLKGTGMFRYRVVAIDVAGNISKPSIVRSTQLYGVPGAPQNVRATKDTFAIKVSWESAEQAKGYLVTRIDPRTSERVECANITEKDLVWFDRISERDRSWVYEVSARNARWEFGEPAKATYTPDKE